MDYFSRGFKSVLGGQEEGKEGPSGAETVSWRSIISVFGIWKTFL